MKSFVFKNKFVTYTEDISQNNDFPEVKLQA